jgi:hypothetical protein
MTSRDSYDAIAQSIVALPRMRQVLDKGNQDYDAFTSWLASALREKSTEAQRVMSAAVAMASKDASDKGQIIELGWLSLRRIINPSAPPVQLTEMRTAFYAGAQHLFASIMTILDPEAEPTEKDLERMSMIEAELRNFTELLKVAARESRN